MKRRRLPRPTERLRIASSGLKVSPICLGMVGDPNLIPAAFAAGINFFFVTTDMHWPLYEKTRRGLKKLLRTVARDQIVVAATLYAGNPGFGIAPVMELLEALPELERIDLYVMGGVYMNDLLPRLEMAQRLRDQDFSGMRAVAASFHDRKAAAYAVRRELVDLAYVRYNAGHPGARRDLFPEINEHQSSTLLYNFTNVPARLMSDEGWARLGLDDNHWRPHPTDFYRFAFSNTPIDGLLCSLKTRAHLTELLAALERGPLDLEEQQYLVDLCSLAGGKATLDPT